MGRVHSQVNGKIGDSLVGPCHPICFILNLFSNGNKVHELFSFAMQEFSILGGSVDQLQNKRSTSHDPTTTGQEISAIEKKQNMTFKTTCL